MGLPHCVPALDVSNCCVMQAAGLAADDHNQSVPTPAVTLRILCASCVGQQRW